ncbi:MAG: DJ-1/PfpI family protein [Alphaproteobacteria bacterium]|nr:DJ-1/PfpI family protein [Alphaproteobacteria bacterium]
MNEIFRTHRRSFLAGSLLALGGGARTAFAQDVQGGYICADCGCASDGKHFAAPGSCPSCGMPLIPAQVLQAPAKPQLKVAILVFEGVQIIDFCGPYEVFGQAGYEVFTVGATAARLLTAMKLQITPTYAFGRSPAADILLIPGGNTNDARHDAATLDWIRNRHAQNRMTMSVCNGAVILAQTGLTATTFHNAIDGLATEFRNVKVINDKRFVDNGKIITTAGLSSGIDGAMHVVSRMEGKMDATLVARNLEYDWNEETKFARAALADYPICKAFGDRLRLYLPDGSAGIVESSTGDRSSWKAVWRLESKFTGSEIVQALSARITDVLKWQTEPASGSASQQTWRFTDPRNRKWTVRLSSAQTSQSGVKQVMMTAILAA